MDNNYNGQQNIQGAAPASKPAFTLDKLMEKNDLIGYAGVALAVIGCFLPFFTISAFGMSYSVNFALNDGEIADGIFVIIAMIIAAALVFKKKNIFACIPWVISVLILVNDLSNASGLTGSYGFVEAKWGIGAYVVILGLIAFLAHLVLYIKGNPGVLQNLFKKNEQPVANVPQPMPTQSFAQPTNETPQDPNQTNNNMM